MLNIDWQTINIVLCLICTAASILLTLYSWRRREVRGAVWFSWMVIAVAWVTFWYVFEVAAGANLEAYLTFSKAEYIGLTLIPLFWLGFALTYSGKELPLGRNGILVLLIIPIITMVLVWTNESHGLIWAQAAFDLTLNPPNFVASYGVGFWVYVAYAYVVYLFGSVVLIRAALGSWRLYRTQALLILAATSLPWISNLNEIFDIIPFGLLFNAICLTASTILLGFALFRWHVLDMMPLAYENILNNIPSGVLILNSEDRIVALNEAMLKEMDNPSADLIGKPIEQVFPRFTADIERLRGVLNSKFEQQTDQRMVEIEISPVYDGNKRLRGRLFVFKDITERAIAEQARRDQQIFAETLRQIANLLSSSLDYQRVSRLIVENVGRVVPHDYAEILLLEGNVGHISEYMGYSSEEGRRLAQLRINYTNHVTLMQAALTNEPVIVNDTETFPGWQDTDLVVSIRAFATVSIRVEGVLMGFISVSSRTPGVFNRETATRMRIFADQAAIAMQNARLYDQTRKQADELNRRVRSLTILQDIYGEIGLQTNPDPLLRLTLQAAVRLCEAEGAYLALMHDGSLAITDFHGRYKREKLDKILRDSAGILNHALKSRRPTIMASDEYGMVTALEDGASAQIALPILMAGGETPIIYGILVLETRRKEAFSEDRFRLMALMIGRVSSALENTRLLDEIRNRAAEMETLYKQVSNLEQLKSDMIRVAAHDLRNPLSVIMTYLTLLLDEEERLETELPRLLQAMHKSAQRMNSIIENILSLERIEKMAQRATMQPLDLRQLVEQALAEYAPAAQEKMLNVSFNTEGESFTVIGDGVQMNEAFANFISNAVKYTPEGGKVEVDLRNHMGYINFTVRDTGYGIPEDQQQRLFEPFYRAKTKETAQIDGTGLGMYLTRNIIERHGGTIIFQSTYGKGSTFGFTVPSLEMQLGGYAAQAG